MLGVALDYPINMAMDVRLLKRFGVLDNICSYFRINDRLVYLSFLYALTTLSQQAELPVLNYLL
jgi:hypothetical protein